MIAFQSPKIEPIVEPELEPKVEVDKIGQQQVEKTQTEKPGIQMLRTKSLAKKAVDKYDGVFTNYDIQRKERFFTQAIKVNKFDRPLVYIDVKPERINLFKDQSIATIQKLKEAAKDQFPQANKELILKYLKLILNRHLLRGFNKWKNTGVPQFQNKYNAYREEIRGIFHKVALDSHQNVKVVRERLLLKKKYRHDA